MALRGGGLHARGAIFAHGRGRGGRRRDGRGGGSARNRRESTARIACTLQGITAGARCCAAAEDHPLARRQIAGHLLGQMLSILRFARGLFVTTLLGAPIALACGACGGGGGAAPADAGGDDAGHSHKDGASDAPSDLPDATCDDAVCTKTDVGLPRPIAGVYDDQGVAPRTNAFRALIAFPMRSASDLQAAIAKMYDPGDPTFRKYMTAAAW